MDMILEYLIQHKTDQPIYSRTIAEEVFPDVDEQSVYLLLKRISNTVDPVVISHVRNADLHNYQAFFEASPLTSRFLKSQGGFTKQHEEEEAAKQREELTKHIDAQIRLDTLRLNKWNKIFLIINGIMALATLLWTIFGPKGN